MSSDQNSSPLIVLRWHKKFYRFEQSNFSTDKSYAPKWDMNYFVITKTTSIDY